MTFELLLRPFVQVLFFMVLSILSIFIFGLKNADNTWTIAGIGYFAFMVINSILICWIPNGWNYFFYSLAFSVLYFLSMGIIIQLLIKAMKIPGSNETSMVFIIIMYHPVFLLVMMFLKWAYFKIF